MSEIAQRDLLVEIGTEELPPTALTTLSRAFADELCQQLRAGDLEFGSVKRFASPRRLAVLIESLAVQQPSRNIEKLGPAVAASRDAQGNFTKAAEGFARGCGVTAADLEIADTDKGERLVFRRIETGAATAALLPAMIETALSKLPVPRRMRWGALRSEFVRPVHWLVVLLGNDVVPCNLFGVDAGRDSRGHRFHADIAITIERPGDYAELLEQSGHVVADFALRKARIEQQVHTCASALGGRALIDPELLDEVTALVEWPVALAGSFDQHFLEVPPEALISAMQSHQKYFPVVDSHGALLPHFITVANIESRDPAQVIAGNEKVIRPRLADAAFFYNKDLATTLQARRAELKRVVFQHKIGSMFDKSERVARLARLLAPVCGADRDLSARAGELCKSDLVSEMVLEFADMQGIAGRYYAHHDGENEAVATALQEQYLPKFAQDALPQTPVGTALALADRLDTLTGIFGIGQKPTGSRDPFALRRASLAVLRLIIENELDIDLREWIATAAAGFAALPQQETLVEELLGYILERLRAWYEDRDIRGDVFSAVMARAPGAPMDIDRRVRAVQAFVASDNAAALAAANKRVANLLEKAGDDASAMFNPALLEEGAEKNLLRALETTRKKVTPLLADGDFTAALQHMAALRQPVDAFFDDVMVMVDNGALRNNRLALLADLRGLFLKVADISLLADSGNKSP